MIPAPVSYCSGAEVLMTIYLYWLQINKAILSGRLLTVSPRVSLKVKVPNKRTFGLHRYSNRGQGRPEARFQIWCRSWQNSPTRPRKFSYFTNQNYTSDKTSYGPRTEIRRRLSAGSKKEEINLPHPDAFSSHYPC
jgi:hypothetical protein